MKVREIMVRPVIVVREDTTLEGIARIMLDHRIGCVPVGIVARHGLLKMMVQDKELK
ncbi:MAG: CBS domain-containing protein [Deltaproteobacteria bacterium]|nr:CBS domain-containing protein [Deltaproteobacteria bacterium]